MNRSPDHLAEEALGEVLTQAQQGHVDHCRECRRRRSTVLAVQEAIRGLPRAAEPPASALALLEGPSLAGRPRARKRHRRAALVAAVAVAAVVGVFIAVKPLHRRPMKEALAEEIALDHLHYEHKTSAAEISGSPGQIGDFFERTLQRRPHLADIEAATVVGGKRCRIDGKWSALIWIERAGRWLSLFSLPGDVVASRGCIQSAGVNVCGVKDSTGGSRVLAGTLPDAEMLRMLDESME